MTAGALPLGSFSARLLAPLTREDARALLVELAERSDPRAAYVRAFLDGAPSAGGAFLDVHRRYTTAPAGVSFETFLRAFSLTVGDVVNAQARYRASSGAW